MNNQVRIAKITAKYLTRHGIRFANAEDVERFFVKSTQILKKQAGFFGFRKKSNNMEDEGSLTPQEMKKIESTVKVQAEKNKIEARKILIEKFEVVLEKLASYGITLKGARTPMDLPKSTYIYAGGVYSFKDIRSKIFSEMSVNSRAKEMVEHIDGLYAIYEAQNILETGKAPRGILGKVLGKIGSFFETIAEYFSFSWKEVLLTLAKPLAVVATIAAIVVLMQGIAAGAIIAGFGNALAVPFAIAKGLITLDNVMLGIFSYFGRPFLVWLASKTGNLFSSMGMKFAGQRSAMYRQTARALYYAR
jgi:hypothetical protein